MKRIFSLILLMFLCSQVMLQAQNTLNNNFGSSASGLSMGQRDRNGNPIDTTAVIDANTIPIGLYSWKIDSRFGNVTFVPVDTLTHAFQNTNDTGGMTGQYNYLGNLGSPRLSRLFFRPSGCQSVLFYRSIRPYRTPPGRYHIYQYAFSLYQPELL